MNLKKLSLPNPQELEKLAQPKKPRRFIGGGEKFLSGPIPLAWLSKAAEFSGKPLAVGLAIWFEAGVTKSLKVPMGHALLAKFHVERKAGASGLRKLERAGLVEVERHAGRNPVVTIIERPKEG